MHILSAKPGHDGHIAYVANSQLLFSHEAEKDAGLRYAQVDIAMAMDTLFQLPQIPDVIAISGWSINTPLSRPIGGGYMGLAPGILREVKLLGKTVLYFSSSHERSHLLCSYALSPFPQGQACYALIWEGHIGAFYFINQTLRIDKLADIMLDPGVRYAFAYGLVDPTFTFGPRQIRLSDAGKLMALAAFDQSNTQATAEERHMLAQMFSAPQLPSQLHKSQFQTYPAYNAGVESAAGKRLARLVSDYIFRFFHTKIGTLVSQRLPLLIGGGCGLNCDWNRAWQDSGLFTDVFIPPCTNDTGSAIGTAADAQWTLSGNAKLKWTVYCGQEFNDDVGLTDAINIGNFHRIDGGTIAIARALAEGAILAWIADKAEIGPRALGNRSILAAPYSKATLVRLNRIKQREQYRPIAPVCLQEDASIHFELDRPSPWMLYFAKVKNRRLQAVTHVDGSARPQTVTADSNPSLHALLLEFKRVTGDGVLCNTSLNFNGTGFINRTSDLIRYATQVGLDGFVVAGTAYLRTPPVYLDLI